MNKLTAFALVLGLSFCSSLPVKQRISQTHQTIHQALVTVDDAEIALCAPKPAAVNTCGNPLAAQLGLTDAKHQSISRTLKSDYDLDRNIGIAMIAWKAGDPMPKDVSTLMADAQAILTTANSISDSSFVGKAQALLTHVQAMVAAFNGGGK